MADTEHRDIYIAAAVGGVGLVLVFMYLQGVTPAQAESAVASAGSPLLANAAITPPPDQTAYNYNVAPYTPRPPIQFPPAIPAVQYQSNSGGGFCNDCGPSTGSQYNDPTVAQFQTLIGNG